MDLLATTAAQAPPAPLKAKKKSDTFESPIVEEVAPGAINVHSDDPTLTVPSHTLQGPNLPMTTFIGIGLFTG